MSQLNVGNLEGLASNSYVITIPEDTSLTFASGSQINPSGQTYYPLPYGSNQERRQNIRRGSLRFNTSSGGLECFGPNNTWLSNKFNADGGYVQDGLILYIDATIAASVSGVGYTTVYDLSGNGNDGVVQGTPGYSTNFGGVIEFNATQGSYIQFPSPNLANSNFTVMVASRYTVASGGGRVLSSYANNWLLGHHGGSADDRGNFYAEGWVNDNNPSTGASNWGIYTGQGDVVGDSYQVYDGTTLLASNSNGSQGPNGFELGRWRSDNEYSQSQVGFMLVYNRVLTDSERNINYDAFKGRYGLL